MIDISLVRSDAAVLISQLEKRRFPDARAQVKRLRELDEQWRKLTEAVDELNKQRNTASTQKPTAEELAKLREAAAHLKEQEAHLSKVALERTTVWKTLPNITLRDVPEGGEGDAELVRQVPETTPTTVPGQQDYLKLVGEEAIDLERAAKVSGSRFVYYKGAVAQLHLALLNYAVDIATEAGFTPVIPPVLIQEAAMEGMGYVAQNRDEIYQTQDNLFLVGTSEQSVGAMHMDELLREEKMPLRYVAVSSCFRREAGSHGKDVRGILRLHQFDKVEMFSFTTPDQSEGEHEALLSLQEKIVASLELPYRVVKLAAGDLGFPSAKTYDIETWIPSEGRYRETHSTSNTLDYQARRLAIRYKQAGKAVRPVHMLNGTVLALPRIIIALLENHQQADGSVTLPAALHPYLPFERITR